MKYFLENESFTKTIFYKTIFSSMFGGNLKQV